MTRFGVHVGLQHTHPDELRSVWRRIEELGFHWISVWDHFYGATGDADDAECLEAVTMHTALALDTTRVEVGCLVYSVGYRHPAVLAKAVTAIDLLSGGRAAIGLGGGWAEVEYRAYGIPFPGAGERLDQLGEAAACVRGLLHDEVTTHQGRHFTLTEARNEPRPVQARIPIWIGGGGEKKTLRVAAQHADGWNIPFVAPETFAHKAGVLDAHCEQVGRPPGEIRRAVNLGLAWDDDSLRRQFGGIAEFVRPGVLGGSDQEVVDRIGTYVEAGADQVNLAARAPFDLDALERFAVALGLH
jgi:F420-dependent oxidoreductase-like protein